MGLSSCGCIPRGSAGGVARIDARDFNEYSMLMLGGLMVLAHDPAPAGIVADDVRS